MSPNFSAFKSASLLLFTAVFTLSLSFSAKADDAAPIAVDVQLGSPAFLSGTTTGPVTVEKPVRDRMLMIAKDQAEIWGDTILEGDYETDGVVRLDLIEAVTRGFDVIAYRITYSARAWDTSTCIYISGRPETLAGCVEGRIVESAYVTPGLDRWVSDVTHLAVFVR